MNTVFITIISVFWFVLLYYSLLTISGLYYKTKYAEKPVSKLTSYPDVDILIPAYNESKVISKTLDAILKLEYPGNMHIYVLNDSSQDDTAEICSAFSNAFKNVYLINVPAGYPKGKPRVLNYGIEISKSEYIAFYDADNQPEPKSLTLLIQEAASNPKAAGAVGYVRTINENKNWLTRMISLEFIVFQLLMQCGRWFMFKTGSLTGTNMVIKRSFINNAGKYDENALAEDAELTIRITRHGGELPIVPDAITWEQEPENLKILIKQRTRWLQGNLYLLEKMFSSWQFFKGKTLIHTFQQILVYLVFLIFLIISDFVFISGIWGHSNINVQIPALMIWYVSYLIYTVQLFSALSIEKNISPANIFVGFILYFTYAQLFILLFFRSLFLYIKAKRKKSVISWDKTVRF